MLKRLVWTAAIVAGLSIVLLLPGTSYAQSGRQGWGGGWGEGGWHPEGGPDDQHFWSIDSRGYFDPSYASPHFWPNSGPAYYPRYGYYTPSNAPPSTYNSYYYEPENGMISTALGEENRQARLLVRVPSANAKVQVGDTQTRQKGMTRLYFSPPLEPGYTYKYHVTVRWMANGKEVVRERDVNVQPGRQVTVDFTRQVMPPADAGQVDAQRSGS